MTRGSTLILRASIVIIGVIVAAICLFVFPYAIATDVVGYGLIIIGMYISAIPLFAALYQTMKLLGYIDKNKAFSKKSVRALSSIKYCALIISGLYAAGMPYIYYVADKDDAPGVVALGCVIVGASFVIATAAAVFQRLTQSAVDIKSENDLTV